MKKHDFNMFKLSLNINIDIDNSLRRITESIKLLNHIRNTEALSEVSKRLDEVEGMIDAIVCSNCSDE